MHNKKLLAVGLACAMMVSLGALTASATTYPACPVEDCLTAGTHLHDGTYYCAHSLDDGHDYHTICSVSGCTDTAAHAHDGVCYLGHQDGDGHSYCGRTQTQSPGWGGGHHGGGRHGGGHCR